MFAPCWLLQNNVMPQGVVAVSSANSLLTSSPSLGPMVPSFHMHSNVSGTPGTSASSGSVISGSMPAKQTASSSESNSAGVLRPTLPIAPVVATQLHPNQPMPGLAPPSQGIWFQAPQIGMMPRPPFLPYPASFPNRFPVPAQGMPLPSVSLPDSQPPGVTPVGKTVAAVTSFTLGQQLAATAGNQTDVVPPGTGIMCLC